MNNFPNNPNNTGGYNNQPPPPPPQGQQYPPPSYGQPTQGYQNYGQPTQGLPPYGYQTKPPNQNNNTTVVVVLGVVAVAAIALVAFVAYLMLARPSNTSKSTVVAVNNVVATATATSEAVAALPTKAPEPTDEPLPTATPRPTTIPKPANTPKPSATTQPASNSDTPIYPGATVVDIPEAVQEDFLASMTSDDPAAAENAKLGAFVVNGIELDAVNEFYADKLSADGWEDFSGEIGEEFDAIKELDGSVIAYTNLPRLVIVMQLPGSIADAVDFGIEFEPEDTLILVITTQV